MGLFRNLKILRVKYLKKKWFGLKIISTYPLFLRYHCSRYRSSTVFGVQYFLPTESSLRPNSYKRIIFLFLSLQSHYLHKIVFFFLVKDHITDRHTCAGRWRALGTTCRTSCSSKISIKGER